MNGLEIAGNTILGGIEMSKEIKNEGNDKLDIHGVMFEMEMSFEKLSMVHGDVNDGYFRKFSACKNEYDRNAIVYEHDRYETFSEIASDYILKLKKDFQKLEQILIELGVK